MEKIVKKLFIAGSLLVGAAVSFMSLTTYAVSAEGSAATNGVSSNTTFSLKVDNVLTLSNVTANVNIAASPTAIKTGTLSATVTSNGKYNLSLSAADTLKSSAGDSIPAVAPVAQQNGWGIRLGTSGSYSVINNTAKTLFTSTTSAPSGTATAFEVGVSVAPSLPAGDYSTTVTVTASAQ